MTTEDSSDVLELWNNLPAAARGVSIAGIVLYLFTFVAAFGFGNIYPWYVTIGLFVWPLVVIVWLLVIWLGFAVFSVAVLLTSKRITPKDARGEMFNRLVKTIVFVPTIIGTCLTLVDAFVSDIFGDGLLEGKEIEVKERK
jgi:hypothetical protein